MKTVKTAPVSLLNENRTSLYRHPLAFLAVQILILVVMISGDAILAARPGWASRQYWALFDVPVHALLGVLVAWPLVVRCQSRRAIFFNLALAGMAAVLIDFDHFIFSGSFSLLKATHMSGRPITHSLLFALLSALIILKQTRKPSLAFLALAALTSHLLRDAIGGGIPFLVWPFEFYKLPLPVYTAVQLGLSAFIWIAANASLAELPAPVQAPVQAVVPVRIDDQ